MSQQSKGKIAVLGSGQIGRSWCMVFVSGGYNVVLFGIVEEQVKNALTDIKNQLLRLEKEDLLRGSLTAEQQFHLISAEMNIEKAVKGAVHVQAHPPHHLPIVELVPAPWTRAEVVNKTRSLMTEVGQSPITLNKEIAGFILTRMHHALLQECLKMAIDDVISVENIDKIFTEGMGMRYSFMGPWENIHLNAEGINSHIERYSDLVNNITRDFGPNICVKDDPRLETVFQQLEALVPLNKLCEKREFRDLGTAKLKQLRQAMQDEDTNKAARLDITSK